MGDKFSGLYEMKSKIIAMVLILSIMSVHAVEITKEIENSRVKIGIESEQEYTQVRLIDPFPICMKPNQISGEGEEKGTMEGMSFVEWESSLQTGKNEFSYILEKSYDCGSLVILQPATLYLESGTVRSESIQLTSQDLRKIEENRCNKDGKCDYPTENYEECPEDCPSGVRDGLCDGIKDGICDDDCLRYKKPDPDCNKNTWIYVLAVILILTAILVATYILRKPRNFNR